MYYLCEKYCKPITVQYCIAECVSWVPRLTLLDLRTNWIYERILRTELVHMSGTYCNVDLKKKLFKKNERYLIGNLLRWFHVEMIIFWIYQAK